MTVVPTSSSYKVPTANGNLQQLIPAAYAFDDTVPTSYTMVFIIAIVNEIKDKIRHAIVVGRNTTCDGSW